MPIRLLDPTKPRTLELKGSDATITYFEARGDFVLYEVMRGMRKALDAAPDDPETGIALICGFVSDWSGFVDDDAVEVDFPAAGKFPRDLKGRPGVPESAEFPTDAELDDRIAALARLPWDVIARVDKGVTRSYAEAKASGKGSSGT